MKISQTGVDLIKSFEGCVLKAYKDPVGIWTLGYGHTGDVKPDDVLTQAEAEELLKTDLVRYEDGVNEAVKVPLNQFQFDALVSFAYNLGVGALKKSTLLELINKGDFVKAAEEFPRWVHAGGKVLAGLVRRRTAERELFLKPVPVPAPPKPPVKKPVKPQPKSFIHVVKSGENLTKIAKKYNMTIAKIAKDNGLKNINLIYAGQKLTIKK